MQTRFVIDAAKFEAAMAKAAGALGRSLPDVYRDEIGRLLALIIKLTPPRNRSQGIQRVYHDILNVMIPVDARFADLCLQRFGRGPYRGKWRGKNGQEQPIAYARILTDPTEVVGWHLSERHQITGRTRRSKNADLNTPEKAWVPKTLFRRYVKAAQAAVGSAKGGWVRSSLAVGRPVRGSWILDKANLGDRINQLHPGAKQQFVAINRSPYAKRQGEFRRIVDNAMATRTRAIPLAVERELKRRYSAAGLIVRGSEIIGL